MGNLEDILKKHAERHGFSRQLESAGVVELAKEEIGRMIDVNDFEIISFKDGILKIGTTSGSVSTAIRLNLSQSFLKENKIKRLIFTEKRSILGY